MRVKLQKKRGTEKENINKSEEQKSVGVVYKSKKRGYSVV